MDITYRIQIAQGEWSPPLDEAGLVAAARAGQFGPQTIIYEDQTGQWCAAAQHRALAAVFSPVGVAMPPAGYAQPGAYAPPAYGQPSSVQPSYYQPAYGQPGYGQTGGQAAGKGWRVGIGIAVVLIICTVFAVIGLFGWLGSPANDKKVASVDGLCEVSVPALWWDARSQLPAEDRPALVASSVMGDVGVIVHTEEMGELTAEDVDDYSEDFAEGFAKELKGSVDKKTAMVTLNGRPRVQRSIRANVDGEDSVYLYSVFCANKSIYQIMGFSLYKDLEGNRATLNRVIASFKETDPRKASRKARKTSQ